MDDPFKLGEKLRQCRVHANYTQEYVAATLGVAKSTYCEYEKGMCTVPNHVVLRAAALLGVGSELFFTVAPLKLVALEGGAHMPPASNVAQELMDSFVRASLERESELLEFMKAQASMMNEQTVMFVRLMRREGD